VETLEIPGNISVAYQGKSGVQADQVSQIVANPLYRHVNLRGHLYGHPYGHLFLWIDTMSLWKSLE